MTEAQLKEKCLLLEPAGCAMSSAVLKLFEDRDRLRGLLGAKEVPQVAPVVTLTPTMRKMLRNVEDGADENRGLTPQSAGSTRRALKRRGLVVWNNAAGRLELTDLVGKR